MTNTLPLENFGQGYALAGLRWVVSRLPVYLIAGSASAIAFLVGATIYAWWVGPALTTPVLMLQEVPAPLPSPPPKPLPPSVADDGDLIAGLDAKSVAGIISGHAVYGPTREVVGVVSEIVADAKGKATGIVIGLDGKGWATKKFVYVPASSLRLTLPAAIHSVAGDFNPLVSIPYSGAELRALPARDLSFPTWGVGSQPNATTTNNKQLEQAKTPESLGIREAPAIEHR